MASKKEEKGRNIQVVVRCRPLSTAERKSVAHCVLDCDHARKEISVRTGGIGEKAARKTYTYDMVFGPSAKQIELYQSVVYPILDEVILGYNCTVFAYGQTGTGKTFTMEGERSPNEEFTREEDPLAGVIPRTLHQIFDKLSKNGTEFSVKVSLLEIYNEELFDLLSPSPEVNERLLMFDDPRNKRGVVIKGLEEITVHNKEEVYHILERGSAKRKTASTLMNAYSSRSHSVFSITIHMKEITVDGEELLKIGKLNLVDLAGSENIGRSGAVEKRAREAGSINQSLLTLGRVITALVERTPHIPYRESKLTRILQDSLGGRTRTSIIATVSPAHMNLEETLSTLDYASRAKNIVNKPEVNQKLTKRTLIKEYTEEIERLKRDLATARDKNGVYLSTESFESMNSRIMSQEEQNTEFSEKISAIEEELKKVKDLFSDSRQELSQCTENLQATRRSLEEAQSDLERAKRKLAEEAFLVSALKSSETALYSTASKLLTTVDASTKDAGGLHEKLDRKKSVDRHNSEAQQRFAEQMEAMFTGMQKAVEEQGVKQQGMLRSYERSVADLLKVNDSGLSGAMAMAAASFGSVRDLVHSGVVESQAGMAEQEALCLGAKRGLQKVLEEHEQELQDTLSATVVPGLTALSEMSEDLRQTLQRHRAVAEQMEEMKRETASFFRDHVRSLARLRETATSGIASLQTEQESLTQRIAKAGEDHATRLAQVISCMESQMSLLGVDTGSGFGRISGLHDALRSPLASLKQTVQTDCAAMEQAASAWHGRADSSASSLVTELRQVGERGLGALEESSIQCRSLQTSLSQLGQDSRRWGETARATVDSLSDRQLSLIREGQASAKALQQGVEASCDGTSRVAEGQLKQQQGELAGPLAALERQAGADQTTLRGHTTALTDHIDTSCAAVHGFLGEGLRRDVPTGGTPQRREYNYSKALTRARTRTELVESFRLEQQQQQQLELQESQAACDTIAEEPDEQDPLEDEMNYTDDCIVTQQPDAEENLMCSESGTPFFKRKNVGKKENKVPKRSKMSENETPSQSKMPLTVHN